jgi:hypothetical protein
MSDLVDLAIKHDYYCSERYETFADFYEEFHDADVDLNLVFRWDLKEKEESGEYYLEIFQIKQRKGIFTPIHIACFDKKDIPLFQKYLKPHIEKLKSIWKPFEF